MEHTRDTNFNTLTRSQRVNDDTGELIRVTQVPDGAGYSIIGPGQRKVAMAKAKQQVEQRKDGKHFAMIYRQQPDLSLLNAGYFMRLLPYIAPNSNGRLCGERGESLTIEEIGKIFDKKKIDAVRDTIKILEDTGAITKASEGKRRVYFVNPAFCHVGPKRDNAVFIKLLKIRAREILQRLTPSEAGFLYRITPYVHFTECFLTSTPDAAPNEELKKFSREQLAHEIDVDVMTVTRIMQGLQQRATILPIGMGNAKHYLVNPDILFRGETEHTPTIRALFNRFENKRGRRHESRR